MEAERSWKANMKTKEIPKEITLDFLMKRWSVYRIRQIIGYRTLFLGSPKVVAQDKYLIDLIDLTWGKNFYYLLKLRDSKEFGQHIFVSQMCDKAVTEYADTCKLLDVNRINIVGSKTFFEESKDLLYDMVYGELNIKLFWIKR